MSRPKGSVEPPRFVDDLRLYEMGLVVAEIRQHKQNAGNILEIGAGTGVQSRFLASMGYSVEAIDVPESGYRESRVWPICDYDGKRIPFPDESFDVVFSSSTLEHIPHVRDFQDEIRRVLRPDGIAIHVVPAAAWSIWTALTHHLFMANAAARAVYSMVAGKPETPKPHDIGTSLERAKRLPVAQLVRRILFPPRHGERGLWISEFYYFSRYAWKKLFKGAGWKILAYRTNGLLYTGHSILGDLLPINRRKVLGSAFGGVCHIFVLKKT